MDIYEVSIEIVPLRGSEHFGRFAGLCVFVYVPADTLLHAIERATTEAVSRGYDVVDIDHGLRVHLHEYERHDADHPTREDLEAALANDVVSFGPFLGYESASEH